ncbi:MAG: hypothetical protein ACKVW3_14435 [Phycisphaerales bacterium]
MLATMWSYEAIAEIAAEALAARAHATAGEQAVRGLDSLVELGFHPLLAAGFAEAGFGVHQEQPYPTPPRRLPRHNERERCDIVLTERPGTLADAVVRDREAARLAGTLFEEVALRTQPAEGSGGAASPSEALWLEVKVVMQHGLSAGVLTSNKTYASELLRGPIADATKLARDPLIVHAGVVVVLFTADEPTADHDLGVLAHRMLDRELPIAAPIRTRVRIPDLLGNAVCTIALVPVRGLG